MSVPWHAGGVHKARAESTSLLATVGTCVLPTHKRSKLMDTWREQAVVTVCNDVQVISLQLLLDAMTMSAQAVLTYMYKALRHRFTHQQPTQQSPRQMWLLLPAAMM